MTKLKQNKKCLPDKAAILNFQNAFKPFTWNTTTFLDKDEHHNQPIIIKSKIHIVANLLLLPCSIARVV